jgi:hypothetical protein
MNLVMMVSNFLEQCGGMLPPLQKSLPLFITACVSPSSKPKCWRLGFAAFYRVWERRVLMWQRVSFFGPTAENGIAEDDLFAVCKTIGRVGQGWSRRVIT